MRTRRSQSSSGPVSQEVHRAVLLNEAIEQLAIRKDDIVVDATLGGAGHALAIAELLDKNGVLIGFDLDADAVGRAQSALAGVRPEVHLVQANFRYLDAELQKLGFEKVTKFLFDLGWSSYQLDSGRGFSFLRDEPLHMGYRADAALNAATIVNEWEETSLADIIYGWGEERYSRRIAKRIAEERKKRRIISSLQLAEIIKAAVPPAYRYGRLHPATRTFQALRIAVNDELGALREGLASAWKRLAPGGRIAVITFHSIEDRIVKHAFAARASAGEGSLIARKPTVPSREEVAVNPRARSSKLRVIEKISNHEKKDPKDKQIRPIDIPGAP